MYVFVFFPPSLHPWDPLGYNCSVNGISRKSINTGKNTVSDKRVN